MVDSLLDEDDDIESEFSMLKCATIEDGTYYAKDQTQEYYQKEKMNQMKIETSTTTK